VLSSTSDFGFTKATAAWHGLDMTKVMGDYLSNLKPGSRPTGRRRCATA
jgi:hypothetical protein